MISNSTSRFVDVLANLDLLLEIILDLPFGFPINNIISSLSRGGGLGSRPKNMYGETLGDVVEYHLMNPTPRR